VITLDQFTQSIPVLHIDRVPVGPVPILNYRLAILTATECRDRYPANPVLIESNGSPEKDATLWRVWRCLY